jgi:hypothetical protein
MPNFNPILNKIGMAWESTFGSASTTNKFQPSLSYNVSVSARKTHNPLFKIGRLTENVATPLLDITNEITIDGVLTNPFVFRAITGTAQSVSGASPPYTHTWSLNYNTTNVASATIDIDDYRYVGCLLRNCSISSAVNDVVKLSMTFESKFQNATVGSPADGVHPDDVVYTYAMGSLTNFPTFNIINSFTMNINANQQSIKKFGQINPANNFRGNLEINLDFEVLFDNSSAIATVLDQLTTNPNYFADGTNAVLKFTYDSNHEITVNLQRILLTDISYSIQPNNIIMARISGRALLPSTNYTSHPLFVAKSSTNTTY